MNFTWGFVNKIRKEAWLNAKRGSAHLAVCSDDEFNLKHSEYLLPSALDIHTCRAGG